MAPAPWMQLEGLATWTMVREPWWDFPDGMLLGTCSIGQKNGVVLGKLPQVDCPNPKPGSNAMQSDPNYPTWRLAFQSEILLEMKEFAQTDAFRMACFSLRCEPGNLQELRAPFRALLKRTPKKTGGKSRSASRRSEAGRACRSCSRGWPASPRRRRPRRGVCGSAYGF